MANPYESSASDESPRRRSAWRLVAALPFYLLGAIYCLMFVRTPGRVLEAWSRYSAGQWVDVVGDAVLAESLWRCTVLPLTGVGLILIGYGISSRRRTVGWMGTIWAIVVFAIGSIVLR